MDVLTVTVHRKIALYIVGAVKFGYGAIVGAFNWKINKTKHQSLKHFLLEMISLDDTIFKHYKTKLDVIIVTYYPAPLEPVKLQYFHPWSCSLASFLHRSRA